MSKNSNTISNPNPNQSQEMQAIELLNQVKQQMSKQVQMLNALKRDVTRSDKLDQGGKSRLRIQIESNLIDLNEEIFAISEDLANAFSASKPDPHALYMKAQEYEAKRSRIKQKIQQSILNNPTTKLVRDEREESIERKVSFSPPQREQEATALARKMNRLTGNDSTPKVDHINNSAILSGSHNFMQLTPISNTNLEAPPTENIKRLGQNNLATEMLKHNYGGRKEGRQAESRGTLGHDGKSPVMDDLCKFTQNSDVLNQYKEDRKSRICFPKRKIREAFKSHSKPRPASNPRTLTRSKSPSLPLRNRTGRNLSPTSREESRKKSRHSKGKPELVRFSSKQKLPDRRHSRRSQSKQSLQTKKELHKAYTIDLKNQKNKLSGKRAKRSRKSRAGRYNSSQGQARIVPKYRGCGAGGVNASLMAIQQQQSSDSTSITQNDTVNQSLSTHQKSLNMPLQIPRNNNEQRTFKAEKSADVFTLQHGNQALKLARQESARLMRPQKSQLTCPDPAVQSAYLPGQGPQDEDLRHKSPNKDIFGQPLAIQQPMQTQLDVEALKLNAPGTNPNAKKAYTVFGKQFPTFDSRSMNESGKAAKRSTSRTKNQEDRNGAPYAFSNTQPALLQGRLGEDSNAIAQFSKDFDLMRRKFAEMQNQLGDYQNNIIDLNYQVTKLTNENLKLTSDMKVISDEHSGVVHKVRNLEKKNDELIRENITLKDIIYRRRGDREADQKIQGPNAASARGDLQNNVAMPPRPSGVSQGSSSRQRTYSFQYSQRGKLPTHEYDEKQGGQTDTQFHRILESPFNNAMIKKSSREIVSLHSSDNKNKASEPEISGIKENDPPPVAKNEQYGIQLHRTERAHLDGPPVNFNYARNSGNFGTEYPSRSRSPLRRKSPEQHRQVGSPFEYHRTTDAALDENASRQDQVLSYIDTEKQSQGYHQYSHMGSNYKKSRDEADELSAWVIERMNGSNKQQLYTKNIKV